MSIKRGDIFWVDLDPVEGSEQAGRRPVLIVQNDIGNEFSPTTIIAPMTTTRFLKEYPTNVFIPKATAGVKFDSMVLLSQVRVIDKSRLASKLGHLSVSYMDKVDKALKISLGI
jgi:mRNA interferase MazF